MSFTSEYGHSDSLQHMPTLAELHAFLVALISNVVALAAGIVGVAFTVYGVLKRETPGGRVALWFALAAYT